MPEGVLLMTCEFFQSSDCERVPPMGKLPRLDPPTPGPDRAFRARLFRAIPFSGKGTAINIFQGVVLFRTRKYLAAIRAAL